VWLAADLDMPAFLDAVLHEPMIIEVHDRTADPEEVPLATLSGHGRAGGPSSPSAEPSQDTVTGVQKENSPHSQAQVFTADTCLWVKFC
jgi:hypothetical protein